MVYLVLAGTIASSLFNALGSLLKYTADPQDKLPEITYWLLGLSLIHISKRWSRNPLWATAVWAVWRPASSTLWQR